MPFITRNAHTATAEKLHQQGLAPLLARLYAARGISDIRELDGSFAHLLAPQTLMGAEAAAEKLAQAIAQHQSIGIVADYDCDGATACAVAVRGLRLLGAQHVQYLVPNRIQDGYGLTSAIAERMHAQGTHLLLTVDNGIASVEGVQRAQALGMTVVITDHHLPAQALPAADAIVNPNQPGCTFGSKNLAGVGVIFYVLLALRSLLRQQGHFTPSTQPPLDTLLPLVALGTVADVVPLDANNRILVTQGLKRIRAGKMPAGMLALFEASGRAPAKACAQDFGFALAPRLNAAGRLTDMTIGIECLLTDAPSRAQELAALLDDINSKRRELEGGMKDQAQVAVQKLCAHTLKPPAGISVFDESFHEGVVGIVASRIKDQFHRPCFVFAPSAADGNQHILKGSGRSIAGFHLRDALDLLAKRHPEVLQKFGGHAMAAGCTIAQEHFAVFEKAFAAIANEWLSPADLQDQLLTDGPLALHERTLDNAVAINQSIWGQGFDVPVFAQAVEVVDQRILGGKHSSLKVMHEGQIIDAIWFGHNEPLSGPVQLAFKLDVNEWMQRKKIQFIVQACESVSA